MLRGERVGVRVRDRAACITICTRRSHPLLLLFDYGIHPFPSYYYYLLLSHTRQRLYINKNHCIIHDFPLALRAYLTAPILDLHRINTTVTTTFDWVHSSLANEQ